jgi:hypothetical protein
MEIANILILFQENNANDIYSGFTGNFLEISYGITGANYKLVNRIAGAIIC